MKITTTGIVLYVRPHGESTAIVSVFTPDMGRVKGLVKGARKKADILQPGNKRSQQRFHTASRSAK